MLQQLFLTLSAVLIGGTIAIEYSYCDLETSELCDKRHIGCDREHIYDKTAQHWDNFRWSIITDDERHYVMDTLNNYKHDIVRNSCNDYATTNRLHTIKFNKIQWSNEMEALTKLSVSKLNANTETACMATKRGHSVQFSYMYLLKSRTHLPGVITAVVKKLLTEVDARGHDYFVNTFALTKHIGCGVAEFRAKNILEGYDDEMDVYGVHCIFDNDGDLSQRSDYDLEDVCRSNDVVLPTTRSPRTTDEYISGCRKNDITMSFVYIIVAFGVLIAHFHL